MKKIGVLIIAFSLLFSCKKGPSEEKITLKDANGRINNLLVVMKNSEWEGAIGDELRKIIAEPVLGLPQPETQFDVTQIPPENFGSMLRATRSILNIGLGDDNSFSVTSNVYASPQKIVTIIGTDKDALITEIKENSDKIISVFKNADIASVQKNILKKYWDPAKIKTFEEQGFSLKIPRNYSKVEDNGDFVWYRYHLNGGNSMELIAYTVPMPENEDDIADSIVAIRNAFGKENIPGQIKDSYMMTEEAYTPHIFEVELAGRTAFETRGKWEVKGVYMAGPFLSYTVIDKPNNRLIVVEGLTFAPSINKRDYMFELEAILKTLKIN